MLQDSNMAPTGSSSWLHPGHLPCPQPLQTVSLGLTHLLYPSLIPAHFSTEDLGCVFHCEVKYMIFQVSTEFCLFFMTQDKYWSPGNPTAPPLQIHHFLSRYSLVSAAPSFYHHPSPPSHCCQAALTSGWSSRLLTYFCFPASSVTQT